MSRILQVPVLSATLVRFDMKGAFASALGSSKLGAEGGGPYGGNGAAGGGKDGLAHNSSGTKSTHSLPVHSQHVANQSNFGVGIPFASCPRQYLEDGLPFPKRADVHREP